MSLSGSGRGTRRGLSVLAAALALHAVVLGWFAWHRGRARPGAPAADADRPRDPRNAIAPFELAGLSVADLAEVALVDPRTLGSLLEAIEGPADQVGFDRGHPHPAAGHDLPGDAGGGGGERVAGPTAATARRDLDRLSTQLWSHPRIDLSPRLRTSRNTSSEESIARRPAPGFDGRESRRSRARDGAELATAGAPEGRGQGGGANDAERAWREADPRFPTGSAPELAMRADGATQPGRASPLIDRGARAAEADQRGPTRDAIDSAAASTARDPMPLELGRTSAGGESDAGGVKGARRAGAPGLSTTMDTAASRANLAPGTGPIALRASRQDPYFRRMYQRLDRAIVFPRELAIALEQGEVVVAFQLRVTDGAIHQLEVVKSSGFAEFDDELLRALRATAPFGTVPAALRGRADHLRVTAPYWFRNTVVR